MANHLTLRVETYINPTRESDRHWRTCADVVVYDGYGSELKRYKYTRRDVALRRYRALRKWYLDNSYGIESEVPGEACVLCNMCYNLPLGGVHGRED